MFEKTARSELEKLLMNDFKTWDIETIKSYAHEARLNELQNMTMSDLLDELDNLDEDVVSDTQKPTNEDSGSIPF